MSEARPCKLTKADGSVCGAPIVWNDDQTGKTKGYYTNPDGSRHVCEPGKRTGGSGSRRSSGPAAQKHTDRLMDVLGYDGRTLRGQYVSEIAGVVQVTLHVPEEVRAAVNAEIGDAAPPFPALVTHDTKSQVVKVRKSNAVGTAPAASAAFKTGAQIAADQQSTTPPKKDEANPSATWSPWVPGHVHEWGSDYAVLTIDGSVDKKPIRCNIGPEAMVLGQLRGQEGPKPVPCSFRYKAIDGVPTIMDFKVVPEPEPGPEPGKTYYQGEMLTRAEIEMRKATAPKASPGAEQAAKEATVEKDRTSPPAAPVKDAMISTPDIGASSAGAPVPSGVARSTPPAQEQPCNQRCMEECDPGNCTAPAPDSMVVIHRPDLGKVSIAVKVNLGNYEMLEVGAETQTSDDLALIQYIDDILGQFAWADEETKARIDAYRKRVFRRVKA